MDYCCVNIFPIELVNLFPTTLPQLLFQRSLESSMVVSPSKVDVDKMFTSDDL